MKINKNKSYSSIVTLVILLFLTPASSRLVNAQGEGQKNENISKSSTVDKGVKLTNIAQRNIGLKLVEADIKKIEDVLIINGIVKTEPDRVAEVSTRIEGRIEKLYAKVGDQVKKGQRLAAILPRQIGNPPPLVFVTAPLTGIVATRNVSVGGTVEPNKTLFRIVNLTEVIVEGEVFESDIYKVKLGKDARISLDAYPDNVFNGKVTFIASELEPTKRTLHIWVTVDNNEGLLKPELFAKIALIVGHSNEAISIPIKAIIDDGVEKFVFVKNGDRFVKQDVATGLSDDRYIEIIDGLYPGDEVVTEGNRQIYTKWLFSK